MNDRRLRRVHQTEPTIILRLGRRPRFLVAEAELDELADLQLVGAAALRAALVELAKRAAA
jgi:hypothetical protein